MLTTILTTIIALIAHLHYTRSLSNQLLRVRSDRDVAASKLRCAATALGTRSNKLSKNL
jgi:hypothetical protein